VRRTSDNGAGCAYSDPAVAWDSNLLALIPQIDACIERAPETRHVSYAGARDGATLVRLQGAERQVDCRVSSPFAGDVTVVEIAPRDENLVIAGESTAIFVRSPGENPGGECYEAPEVRDANGTLLGWMLDPEGC